jgi:hypothetical protein
MYLPENVKKNYKHYTDDQLAVGMTIPAVATELLKLVSQMDDRQLRIVFPFMEEAQIKKVIPQLQLQQQGIAVQVMSPQQIRYCVAAIPSGDRSLLLQNITLILQADSRMLKSDEIQSFIGFIDPLAMAVAVERPEMVDKVIEATCVMTAEQIRVIIPLLNIAQIRQVFENVESDDGLKVATEMLTLERKKELIALFEHEISELNTKREEYFSAQLSKLIAEHIPALKNSVEQFCQDCTLSSNLEREFRVLSEQMKKVRSSIEKLQRDIRKTQTQLKLPLRILTKNQQEKLHELYTTLAEQLVTITQQLHEQALILDKGNLKDGLVHQVYAKWQAIKEQWVQKAANDAREADMQIDSREAVFVEEDQSVVLYEAIKKIGNPAAINDIYKITWDDIIHNGFRTERDFADKRITSLKELEEYITKQKQMATANVATEPAKDN